MRSVPSQPGLRHAPWLSVSVATASCLGFQAIPPTSVLFPGFLDFCPFFRYAVILYLWVNMILSVST